MSGGVLVGVGSILFMVIAVMVVVVAMQRMNRPKCPHCGLSVDRDLDTCPYCHHSMA